MIKAVPARTFLAYSTDILLEQLRGDFNIVFEDGLVCSTNDKLVCYSSFAWEFHRRYPKTPLLSKHFLGAVLGTDMAGDGTHLKLINSILWDVYDTYAPEVESRIHLRDDLAKLAYQITNEIFNKLSLHCEEYVTSINILDFMGIARHPEVLNAIESFDGTPEGVDSVYKRVLKCVATPEISSTNALARIVNAGLVNKNQFLQCVALRGFATDVDSYQFKKPIAYGFFHGIRNLTDSVMEAKSAAKNLFFSKDPLRQSEYFSRRQQLQGQNVQNLHSVDCGSQKYLSWHIRDTQFDLLTGLKSAESDLLTLDGKYYLCEQTNTLKIISKKDKHLIGKTVKIRSPISGCAHTDPYGICEVCFGEASLAVPENTNIGHMAVTLMTQRLSQSILSVKHLDGSAIIAGIVIEQCDKKWLSTNGTSNKYFLNNDLRNKKVQILFKASQAPGLCDINNVADVRKLNVSRISTFDTITIAATGTKGTEIVSLPVFVENRLSSLTHEFLNHIKLNGWRVAEDDIYIVEMDTWDYQLPILSVPLVHFNMSDHQNEIANILEATMKDIQFRDNEVSPENMIVEFHDLVNKRINPPISLAVLEVVLLSAMITSAANHNYGIPKSFTESGLGVMKNTIAERSLSAGFAYERQRDMICSSGSVIRTNRPDHPMDGIVMPEEVFGPKYGRLLVA